MGGNRESVHGTLLIAIAKFHSALKVTEGPRSF